MKRIPLIVAASLALMLVPARPALAGSCAPGHVVWIEAYNSADGTYKAVFWQGGSRYFAGSGTDYVNTHRRANASLSIDSNSSSKSATEFCVPDGVELADGGEPSGAVAREGRDWHDRSEWAPSDPMHGLSNGQLPIPRPSRSSSTVTTTVSTHS